MCHSIDWSCPFSLPWYPICLAGCHTQPNHSRQRNIGHERVFSWLSASHIALEKRFNFRVGRVTIAIGVDHIEELERIRLRIQLISPVDLTSANQLIVWTLDWRSKSNSCDRESDRRMSSNSACLYFGEFSCPIFEISRIVIDQIEHVILQVLGVRLERWPWNGL